MILPLTILRRFDAGGEPGKHALLRIKPSLDALGIVRQHRVVRQAAMHLYSEPINGETRAICKAEL